MRATAFHAGALPRAAARPRPTAARPAAAGGLRGGAAAARAAAPRRAARAAPLGRRRAVGAVALLDYVATASDDGVLRLPARTELDASEVKSVFGYPRRGPRAPAGNGAGGPIACRSRAAGWRAASAIACVHRGQNRCRSCRLRPMQGCTHFRHACALARVHTHTSTQHTHTHTRTRTRTHGPSHPPGTSPRTTPWARSSARAALVRCARRRSSRAASRWP
jgi:hypothetical protein